MMIEYKVSVQSLVDHINTAIDVDPWAKAMVEDMAKRLEEQEVVRCKDCRHIEHLVWLDDENVKALVCKKHTFIGYRTDDWFCADWERESD